MKKKKRKSKICANTSLLDLAIGWSLLTSVIAVPKLCWMEKPIVLNAEGKMKM